MGWTRNIPVDELQPSPLNPRRDFGDLDDLAASLKAHGLKQALVVRNVGVLDDPAPTYEIVCGHRRARAAKIAGIETLRCDVVEADDRTALETMLVENSQRHDVSPLDESDGLIALIQLGGSAEEIGKRLGPSSKWVRNRIALGKLVEEGRELLRAGMIDIMSAVAIAMLDRPYQVEIAGRIELRGVHITLKGVQRMIAENRLESAPWDLDDTTLGGRGACSTCPRRTVVQADLWSGASSEPAKCTDPSCWALKRKAYVERLAETGEVLDAKPKDAFDLDAVAKEIGSDKTWREEVPAADVHYVVSDHAIMPVVYQADVHDALNRDGRAADLERLLDPSASKAKSPALPQIDLAKPDDIELAHLRLLGVVEKNPDQLFTLIGQAIVAQAKHRVLDRIAKRRKMDVADLYEVQSRPQLMSLLLEIAIDSDVQDARRIQIGRNSFFAEALRHGGVRTPAHMLRADSPGPEDPAENREVDGDMRIDWSTVAKVAAERALATSGTSAILVGVPVMDPSDAVIVDTLQFSSKTRSGAVLAKLIESGQSGPWLIVSGRPAGAVSKAERAAAARLSEAARLLEFPLEKVAVVAGKSVIFLGGSGDQ